MIIGSRVGCCRENMHYVAITARMCCIVYPVRIE